MTATTIASPVRLLAVVIVVLATVGACQRQKAASVSSPVPFGKRVPVRLLKVSDGDTIVVGHPDTAVPGKLRVRMRYIDAPESSQPHGNEATRFLRELLSDSTKKLSLTFDTFDFYNRALGVVYHGRRNVNRLLLAEGHAWCYQNRCPAPYERDLNTAKEGRLGLWRDPSPQSPWDYRKEKKQNYKKARGDL